MPGVVSFKEDFFERIINVTWGVKGCRFAVCGYDGTYITPPFGDPVFFGVGAYSDDGKSWTRFKVFENGITASVFNMRDPKNKKQDIVFVGGCTNQGDDLVISTAQLTTIIGSGPSAGGGTLNGRNVAGFGNLGYDTKKGTFYAVENPGGLHTFQIGKPSASQSSDPKKPTIFWAGTHYPGIGPVYDCSTDATGTMTFEDKNGKKHTLKFASSGELQLDDVGINPSGGSTQVVSAAGGANDKGENIIIAVGYNDDGGGIAWWSIDGKGWTEITGLWTGDLRLQAAQMATAVPNS